MSALDDAWNALDSLWAAIGDRLLANGPLDKAYANGVMSEIDAAKKSLDHASLRATNERLDALDSSHCALPFVVEYIGRDGCSPHSWKPMAAFDIKQVAEGYRDACSGRGRPWEYRVRATPLE